ncbi:MAG: PilZ domain-containing protein [Hyphomicrobiaceae bacterium]
MYQSAINLDRRNHPRKNLNKPGILRVQDAGSFVCHVKDISLSGAMLLLVQPVIFPRIVRFFIPEDQFFAACKVIHQDGRRLGLQFLTNQADAQVRYG